MKEKEQRRKIYESNREIENIQKLEQALYESKGTNWGGGIVVHPGTSIIYRSIKNNTQDTLIGTFIPSFISRRLLSRGYSALTVRRLGDTVV